MSTMTLPHISEDALLRDARAVSLVRQLRFQLERHPKILEDDPDIIAALSNSGVNLDAARDLAEQLEDRLLEPEQEQSWSAIAETSLASAGVSTRCVNVMELLHGAITIKDVLMIPRDIALNTPGINVAESYDLLAALLRYTLTKKMSE